MAVFWELTIIYGITREQESSEARSSVGSQLRPGVMKERQRMKSIIARGEGSFGARSDVRPQSTLGVMEGRRSIISSVTPKDFSIRDSVGSMPTPGAMEKNQRIIQNFTHGGSSARFDIGSHTTSAVMDENQRIISNIARDGHTEISDFGPPSISEVLEERPKTISNITREGSSVHSDVGLQLQPAPEVTVDRQCRLLRDLPDTPREKPAVVNVRSNYAYEQCLQYKCERENYEQCDTAIPTNYDGPDPPCCVHILRDMAKAFDDAMCELGFEYFASYGMLLGLVRSDRLVPWTSDNDFVITKQTMAGIMALTPEEKAVFDQHGISILFDNFYYRVCITPAFMEGKLATSWVVEDDRRWYPLIYPYTDIFVAHEEDDSIVDELGCAHPIDVFRPALHMGVYNNTFRVSVPHDAETILGRLYGPQWRTPDAKKAPHGDTKCDQYINPFKDKSGLQKITGFENFERRPALLFPD